MASCRKSFCPGLQFVTTRRSSKSSCDSIQDAEREETKHKQSSDCEVNALDDPSKSSVSKDADNVGMDTGVQQLMENKAKIDESQTRKEHDGGNIKSFVNEEKQIVSEVTTFPSYDGASFSEDAFSSIDESKEHVRKKHFVKFTLSIESNSEEELTMSGNSEASDSPTDLRPQQARAGIGRKISEIPKESSSLPSLRLNLCSTESVSSPECGSSPEIHYSHGRIRMSSGDGSLTSTPVRVRRQTFCGISYLSRRNLSQNNLDDSEDVHSVSATDFFPGSTLSRLGAERFHGTDELSYDTFGQGKLRESSDYNDDTDVRVPNEHLLTTPINKQLRIVTSVDRALHPHRRSSMTSPKVLNLGRSSSENLEHIAFIDYLKRRKLGQYLKHFPSSMALLDFSCPRCLSC